MLALLVGCSDGTGSDEIQPGDSTPGGRSVDHRTKVVVESLTIGPVRDKIVVSAKVAARTSVDIIPKIPNVPVTEIFVEEGDQVELGQILMSLYDTDLKLAEQTAKTVLDEAHRNLQRTELTLQEDARRVETAERAALRDGADFARLEGLGDLVTDQEVDNARVAAEDAQDNLELAVFARQNTEIERELGEISVQRAQIDWTQAITNLGHTSVRAPIAGIVAKRDANVGMLTTMAAAAFVVVDTTDLVLNLRIPQDNLLRLQRGQLVEVRSVTGAGTNYAGVVRSVNPVLDETTGTISVVVDLTPAMGLVPGLFCEASIITSAREEALLVSKRAVLYENDQPVIFAVKAGEEPESESALKIPFVAGATTAGEVEILCDLEGEPISPDLMVIVVGQENLKDGAPITVVEEAF